MERLAELEALLFVAGEEGFSMTELASLLEVSVPAIRQLTEKLMEKYTSDSLSGLTILEVGEKLLLSTKKECAPVLQKYAASPVAQHLSQAALETLAIIAYKQPITRAEVDEVRGVQSAAAVQKLVSKQLVESKGRVDGPGRAILYGTTAFFMNFFGLKELRELPSIEDMEADFNEVSSDLFYDRFKEELIIDEADSEEEKME